MDKQILSAEKQGEGTDVAVFEETIYAIFMHYVKTGERCFPADMSKGDYSLIYFKEKIDDWRIVCGFGRSGLAVYGSSGNDGGRLRVAVSRKSIGTCILGT